MTMTRNERCWNVVRVFGGAIERHGQRSRCQLEFQIVLQECKGDVDSAQKCLCTAELTPTVVFHEFLQLNEPCQLHALFANGWFCCFLHKYRC